jgi:hypothetical protein
VWQESESEDLNCEGSTQYEETRLAGKKKDKKDKKGK